MPPPSPDSYDLLHRMKVAAQVLYLCQLNGLASGRNKNIYPLALPQPLLHFFCYVVLEWLYDLFPWMASLGPLKRWKSKGTSSGLYGGWGWTVIQVLWWFSCIFKFVCVSALSCWRRILVTFLWGLTLLASWCKVLRVQMYSYELIVWLHDIMFTRITLSASQKHWSWLLSWSGSHNSILLRRSWMVLFH